MAPRLRPDFSRARHPGPGDPDSSGDSRTILEHVAITPSLEEGFALDAVTVRLGVETDRCYFWRTHTGAELDLLVIQGGRKWGFEIKRTTAPKVTRSMHSALEDLGLERLDVVHAGERTFPLRERVRALSLSRLWEDLEPLG